MLQAEEVERVIPDLQFKRELGRMSGAGLSQCMQCGNCSAVCAIAPEERPFPRKEMVWAGWGLRERLVGNADLWLCHQCGDCSTHCPRDVRPSDVIAALRQRSYLHYARPAFLGKLVNRPAWLPVAILIPVVVISAILLMAGTFRIPEGEVDYSAFFPHAWLNGTFTGITLLFYGLAAAGLTRFWKDMRRSVPSGSIRDRGFRKALGEILGHTNFSGCRTENIRKMAHLLVFYGFALLILVTLYAIWASVSGAYPLEIANPFKIAGNVASIMIYVGLGIMVHQRITRRDLFGKNSYADWLLLVSVGLLTLSGSLVQWARFGNWQAAYHLYFFHLVAVWFVIMYLPFTKLAHILYRTAALTFARSAGRR